MWWFIITFVIGMAVGKRGWLPTAFLRKPQGFVWPSLAILLILLGYQIGSDQRVLDDFAQIGWQSLVIAACAMVGSGACAAVTYRLFFPSLPKKGNPPANEALSEDVKDE